MILVLQGAALFLFIPLVLFLFLRLPLGPGLSLGLGLGIMFGHRFLAAPWMGRHAAERCLWCGRAGNPPVRIAVASGGKMWTVGACGAAHAALCGRFFSFVSSFRAAIGAGIFVPLVVLLGGTLSAALGHPLLPHSAAALLFRTIVAFTVVTTSLLYRFARDPEGPISSPFPLHNLFLLGIRNTLWVFRIVGAWWLAAAAIDLLRS
jgi:hypothetical protein